jgi:hypothetical protein
MVLVISPGYTVVQHLHYYEFMNKHLIDVVARQLGESSSEDLLDTYRNIAAHGADSCWVGFTYTRDTVDFWESNRDLILASLKDMASELGEKSTVALVASFRCLSGVSQDEIAETLFGECPIPDGRYQDLSQIANALSWYALEEVARYVSEEE